MADTGSGELRGLGPRSREWLSRAGIRTAGQLRELGAVEAFRRVREHEDAASLNLLWALEGALTGRDWKEVARTERERLLRELGAA